MLTQPENDLAFERIINVPKRGLGGVTMNKLHQLARAQGIPLYEAVTLMVETEELTLKPRRALIDLITQFDRWRGLLDAIPHWSLDRKSTRLNSSHYCAFRMPSSARQKNKKQSQ